MTASRKWERGKPSFSNRLVLACGVRPELLRTATGMPREASHASVSRAPPNALAPSCNTPNWSARTASKHPSISERAERSRVIRLPPRRPWQAAPRRLPPPRTESAPTELRESGDEGASRPRSRRRRQLFGCTRAAVHRVRTVGRSPGAPFGRCLPGARAGRRRRHRVGVRPAVKARDSRWETSLRVAAGQCSRARCPFPGRSVC